MLPADRTTDALVAAMRGMNLRQQALAQNVANADTPGYQRVDVDFEGALGDAIAAERGESFMPDPRLDRAEGPAGSTDEIAAVEPEVASPDEAVMRVDGGGVDPDAEMAELAANQLAYQTMTGLVSKRFGQLAYVINGH